MLFRRKGWLKQEFNQMLMEDLIKNKNEWNRQKQLIDKSLEPSPEVLYELKVAEAKYFFLLKEAKHRQVKFGK
ncbi:YaaL family protein [Metabacillus sp. RGM 3146]|uniref:YaaL family protein n=1 Tax=Metabacillus sp. RGM 3146 TaxID=3401092 RepID=UPI003B9C349E